jgi:hypothetical protein
MVREKIGIWSWEDRTLQNICCPTKIIVLFYPEKEKKKLQYLFSL